MFCDAYGKLNHFPVQNETVKRLMVLNVDHIITG
jgi:hypothetical protein